MGIRAFGSITVDGPSGPVGMSGARERAVLGLLIAHVGRVVADDVLIDVLWGDDVDPDAARRSLRVRVSGVRRALASAGATVERIAGGYRLITEPEGIDVARFRTAAARALAEGPAEATVAAADAALGEWVDEPFAELRFLDAFAAVRSELEEIRRAVVEARTHALIDLGRAAAVPAVLAAVEEAPEDETLARAAMRALAAAGRSNEALGVFDRLAVELAERGLEPSPETRDLESDVVRGTPMTSVDSEPTVVRHGVPGWGRPIGRDDEVEEVARVAASERVISILGPGGVGKTRVAAAVARAISGPESVWWVPLQDAVEPASVLGRIAGVLGVTRRGSEPFEDAIFEGIGSTRGLLVLDNAEQAIAACRGLVEVAIARCPRLVVLVTSQAPLGLRTERRIRLTPMSLPSPEDDDPASLAENPAVQLFTRAAERIGAPPVDDLVEVAALVRELEGMPLAIELAAAQSDLYTPSEMLVRLHADPEALEAGRDHPGPVGSARWSIALLEPEERHLLADLAVLPGDFSPHLAEAIGASRDAARRVRTLVERSLLEVTPSASGARLHLLDSVRAAAPPPDDPDLVGARLVGAMTHLVSRLEGLDAPAALTQVTTEIRLLDAAFRHALETEPEAAVELASRLGWYWSRHGDWTVGTAWYDAVLDLDLDGMDPGLTMPVLQNAGVLALFAGRESARAEAIFTRLDEIARRTGRRRPFNVASLVHSYRGRYEQAIALLELQVAQDEETGHDASTPLANLAHLHLECGRLDEADAYIHRARAEAFRRGTETVTHTALIEAQLWAERGSRREQGMPRSAFWRAGGRSERTSTIR